MSDIPVLELAEWRARFVRFCPTCNEETLPLRNGTCGFCDTLVGEPDPLAKGKGCAICGHELPPARPSNKARQRYCSANCAKRAWRDRTRAAAPPPPPLPLRSCDKCGTEYSPARSAPHQRFCSVACRMATNAALYCARRAA